MDLDQIGQRFREVYGNEGVAKDGRRYADIPDQEIGALFIRSRGGVDKAVEELGLTPQSIQPKVENIQEVTNLIEGLGTGTEREGARQALRFAQETQETIDALEAAKAGGLPGASGPVTNLLTSIATKLGFDPAEAELRDQAADVRQLIRRERTGLRFSPEEEKELEQIFGSISTQEEPLERKLIGTRADAIEEIALKTGLTRDDVLDLIESDVRGEGIISGEGGEAVTRATEEGGFAETIRKNPVANFLLGDAFDFAQDVGVGLGLRGETGEQFQQSQDLAIEQANKAFDKADEIEATDPEQAERLRQVANDTLQQVGFNAENIGGLFSESIDEPLIQRGALTGAEVAGVAEIPAITIGLVRAGGRKLLQKGGKEVAEEAVEQATKTDLKSKAVKIGEKIEGLSPRKILGEAQREAANLYKGVKPLTDEFIKVGKNLADQDPDIAREFAKQEEFLKKIDSIPKLLDRMQTWGRRTYLKTGGLRAAAKADLYDSLYKEGLRQLKELAPEVYKNRSLLRFSYELPRAAGKALWRLTLGRIGLGAF